MKIQVTECTAPRPDRRAIAQAFEVIGDDVDAALATELTGYLLEGSPVELEISFNESSAYRTLRKLSLEYEIVEE